MNEYKLPVLITTSILNLLISLAAFNIVVVIIGVALLGSIGAILMHTVSSEDALNTMTILNLVLSVVLVGSFVIAYMGTFLVLLAILGVAYVIFKGNKR